MANTLTLDLSHTRALTAAGAGEARLCQRRRVSLGPLPVSRDSECLPGPLAASPPTALKCLPPVDHPYGVCTLYPLLPMALS